MVDGFNSALLPHLDHRAVAAAYDAAPGNEIASGKFFSPESSSALVANAFGLFLSEPSRLPPLPGTGDAWSPRTLVFEGIARFPWAGGRHPCLDVLVQTEDLLFGIESKRFEPFRGRTRPPLSGAYWRPVWGERMAGYQGVRDGLRDGALRFAHLDATQLVKHAFGLRTAAVRAGKGATLYYVHCEPRAWPDGRTVPSSALTRHREELAAFATLVADDEVAFRHATWTEVIETWLSSSDAGLRRHATAVLRAFPV